MARTKSATCAVVAAVKNSANEKTLLFGIGLFPELFAQAYNPPRQGRRGPHPHARYRIPRTAAHVQIIKHQSGYRLKQVEIRYVHGSKKRI